MSKGIHLLVEVTQMSTRLGDDEGGTSENGTPTKTLFHPVLGQTAVPGSN